MLLYFLQKYNEGGFSSLLIYLVNTISLPLVIAILKEEPNAKSHHLKKILSPNSKQSEFMTELNRLKIFYHNKSWCY